MHSRLVGAILANQDAWEMADRIETTSGATYSLSM
jgi:hypothetical protein